MRTLSLKKRKRGGYEDAKMVLCLLMMMVFQLGYGAVMGLGQEDKELQRIKKVVWAYYEGLAK